MGAEHRVRNSAQLYPSPFTPPDHEIVWGLGMGSRIRRDKLFWFAALDSYHRNDPGLSTVRNPAEFFNLPEPTSASVTLLSAQLGESQNQAYSDYLGSTAPTPPPPPNLRGRCNRQASSS